MRSFLIDPERLMLDTPLRLLSQAGLLVTLLAGREIEAHKRGLLALYTCGYLAGLAVIRLDPRYMVILLPVLVFCAVYFLWAIIPRCLPVGRLSTPARTIILATLLAWSGTVPADYLHNAPTSSQKVINVTNVLSASGMGEAGEVLSSAMHFHDVSVPTRTRYVQSYRAAPGLNNVEELHAVAREKGYHFILYDAEKGLLAHPGLEALLDPSSRPAGLTPLLIPESWKYVLYRIEGDALQPAHALDARLSEGISLTGYDLFTSQDVPKGSIFRVGLFLYWQAAAPISQPYKVFVHVLDASRQLVAQDDGLPAQWTYPTDEWQVGETVVDFHTLVLPPGSRSGTYTIQVGMYDETTMQRLPVLSAPNMSDNDQVTLAPFTVDPSEGGKDEQ